MSVLLMARGLTDSPADVEATPLTALPLAASYLDALRAWSIPSAGWHALTPRDAPSWDDHVDAALADAPRRRALVARLEALAGRCAQLAVWYAGFPDDIDRVSTPRAFAATLDAQLCRGEHEPACRVVAAGR